MRSIFVNDLRRRSRRPREVSVEELESIWDREVELEGPAAMAQVLDNEKLEWHPTEVQQAIAELPEPFREAIALVDVGELSYEEAAEVAGCPVGTLRSRLHRGRRHLAKRLVDYARDIGFVKEADSGP